MAIGYGLSALSQQPNGNDELNSFMEQFSEWLRKRGTNQFALGGKSQPPGVQQPIQQSIQQSTGTSEREHAGDLRTATGEGAATFMQQAGETAAEPWKPQALDIALIAASVAGPIIAALQPEGRGRRGQRKQQRMSNLFKSLGGLAEKGVEARMESFGAGKKAEFGAAKETARMSVEESQAQYGRTIGDIGAAESTRRFDKTFGLAEQRETRMGLPQPVAGAERLALDREKFTYDKEQDELSRQRQITEDYAKGRVGPFPFGVPTAKRYPEGYTKAVVDLNKAIASKDWSPDVKAEALEQGIRQLKQVYGIGTTGNTGASALLEQLRQEQGPLENLR